MRYGAIPMTTVLLLLGPNGILYALGAAVVAAFGLYMRTIGKNAERARQAKAEAKARDISDEIDDAVAGRSPDENRKRLGRWSKS